MMMVRSVMKWSNGTVSVRTIDWDDREAVRNFARVSFGCLRDGGTVITSAVEMEDTRSHNAQVGAYIDNLVDIGRKLTNLLDMDDPSYRDDE